MHHFVVWRFLHCSCSQPYTPCNFNSYGFVFCWYQLLCSEYTPVKDFAKLRSSAKQCCMHTGKLQDTRACSLAATPRCLMEYVNKTVLCSSGEQLMDKLNHGAMQRRSQAEGFH
eukprot:TRINITY_DN35439_c0_g1_i1.p1 TRINITY_DN35439_c0_g1~~TRINITY_DN35439_c0_g1_i1.p1  ORF type:complete len:114 (+),score=13.89 TRINITY_DN35439_c0_g1_i1:183-524(+)